MQLESKFGCLGGGNSVILYCQTGVPGNSRQLDSVYVRWLSIIRRESGVRCRLRCTYVIYRSVPMLFIYHSIIILFISVYLWYLFIAVRGEKHLRVTRLYTRSRVFECFKKDGLMEPLRKIEDRRDMVVRF